MKWFTSSVQIADIFGRNLMFEEHNSQIYKTHIGGVASIISCLAISIFTIILGRELYQRKTPLVTNSIEISENPILKISDFPLMFLFFDSNIRPIKNVSEVLNVEVQYIENTSNKQPIVKNFPGLLPCDYNNYNFNKEFVKKVVDASSASGVTPVCPDVIPDYEVYDVLASEKAKNILITVKINIHI